MSERTEQLKSALASDIQAHFGQEFLDSVRNSETWWPDISPQQFEMWQLWKSIVKKYNDEDLPSVKARAAALEKFTAVNAACGEWEDRRVDIVDDHLVGVFQKNVERWYHLDGYGETAISNLHSHWENGDVGPGASVSSRGFDFYTKLFDGSLSSTSPNLLEIWRRTALKHPLWRNAERTRSTRYEDNVVRGNSLSFVNKNVDTARCISTEPLVNMWFQKGLKVDINKRTKSRYGIDLSLQPEINKRLAKLGSELETYATIDLESASDSISVRMLERYFPKGFVAWLKLYRSPMCKVPGNGWVKLNMIATMGNDFCFPLQTLIFTCVVAAVYELRGISMKSQDTYEFDPRGKNFGVFGDDIIVVTEAVPWVKRLLYLLGFKVNADKTHVEGPFRESCGFDAFKGRPVRGVYIKRLRTAQDTFVAVNTLNRWSARSGVPLKHTVSHLLDTISAASPMVPADEDDTAGIHVPLTLAVGITRGAFGVWRYRKDTPMPVEFNFEGHDYRSARITEAKLPPHMRIGRRVNLAGSLMAFLGGYLNGGSGGVSVRNDLVQYQTKHCITPHWDYNPSVILTLHGLGVKCRPNRMLDASGFAAWSAATRVNLCGWPATRG